MSNEYKIHKIINHERKKRGLSPALWSARLSKLAFSQAKYCAKINRLVHSDRYAFQGGENLAMFGGHFNSRAPLSCWLKSPPHREFLLSPRVTKAGVGLVRRHGRTYVAWAFSDEFPYEKIIPTIKNIFRKITNL